MLSLLRGKYRNIILSIAVFIVLDAVILSLNFYISYALSGDAIAVSKVGQLQMMSQRLVKSIYELKADVLAQTNPQRPFAELKTTVLDFDEILAAFTNGGLVSADNEQSVVLTKMDSPVGRDILNRMNDVWKPFNALVYPVIAVPEPVTQSWFIQGLADSERYAASNNLTLLKLATELADHTEQLATRKAANLRLGQTVGIFFAIINFIFIVYHLIRQLRRTDENIAAVQEETRQILDTVSEGLFLIDKNLIISGQYSRFAEKIFGTKKISGKKLTELLTGKVDQEIVGTLSRYLLILLNDRVKQDLAVDLNPLSRVKLMVPLSDGRTEEKVVSFNFLRTLNKQGVVSHILVTIQDITALSEAEAKVQQLSQGVSGQLEIVAKIMDVTPEKFCHFCDRILVRLLDINKILKLPSRKRQQFRSQVDMIAIELHRMKGESALLGFASLATSIHQLESVLDKLQKQPMLVGESFVPFTVGLKQLIGEVEKFLLVANALANGREKPPLAESMEERTLIEPKMIENLVQNIANKNRKTVRVLLQQKGVVHIPQHLHQPLRDITVQLVRNAVVHGLEDCQGRANKPKAGRLQIEILAHSGEVTIVVADDGRGIALDKLRQRAITLGIGEPHELNNLSSDRLLNLIFESGLSTRLQVDEDAGRGVGMSVVKTMVQRLAGKIAVRNQEGKGTRFIILIPLAGLSYENLSLAAS